MPTQNQVDKLKQQLNVDPTPAKPKCECCDRRVSLIDECGLCIKCALVMSIQSELEECIGDAACDDCIWMMSESLADITLQTYKEFSQILKAQKANKPKRRRKSARAVTPKSAMIYTKRSTQT